MINAYKATIGGTNENLTDGKKIYWKNVRKLVQFLADNEAEFFKNEMKFRDKKEKNLMPDITPEDKLKKFESIPMYERSLEKFINPFKKNWQIRYYKTLFNIDIDETRRKNTIIRHYYAILFYIFHILILHLLGIHLRILLVNLFSYVMFYQNKVYNFYRINFIKI